MAETKTCFVIAPIGSPGSDVRKWSDQVLKHVLTPAATECGYTLLRADKISEPGIITSQVIEHVVNDPLVIADLTGWNPNVFYELAIRHALRKPLVQIIKSSEDIPFDVAVTRTVKLDIQDLDSVEEAKSEIISQIRALETDSTPIDTPISVALEMQLLRDSKKPEDRSLAGLVRAVSELRSSIAGIEKRIGNLQDLVLLQTKARFSRDRGASPGFMTESIFQRYDMGSDGSSRIDQLDPAILQELVSYVLYALAKVKGRGGEPSASG